MIRRRGKALCLALVLCLALTSCGGGFYDKNAKDGLLDGKTQEEIDAMQSEVVPEGMLHVSINSNAVFQDGTAAGNLRIENAPGNPYDMRVTIVLADTSEEVYASGGVKPGQYIDSAPLDKSLEAGTYAATAKFYAVDKKHKDVGLVTREITLNILE